MTAERLHLLARRDRPKPNCLIRAARSPTGSPSGLKAIASTEPSCATSSVCATGSLDSPARDVERNRHVGAARCQQLAARAERRCLSPAPPALAVEYVGAPPKPSTYIAIPSPPPIASLSPPGDQRNCDIQPNRTRSQAAQRSKHCSIDRLVSSRTDTIISLPASHPPRRRDANTLRRRWLRL